MLLHKESYPQEGPATEEFPLNPEAFISSLVFPAALKEMTKETVTAATENWEASSEKTKDETGADKKTTIYQNTRLFLQAVADERNIYKRQMT